MHLTRLTLHNFRCFSRLDLTLENPLLLIEGPNGSGKSSIGEALYYACYLKSFRAHKVHEITLHNSHYFFIELQGITADGDMYTITIGVENGIKKIKVNHSSIHSYKELIDYYQVIMVSEHDMRLLQDGPEERRSWINQLCILKDPTIIDALRLQKHILMQRAQLLMTQQGETDHYAAWSKQLWENSHAIRTSRNTNLMLLEKEIAILISEYALPIPPITFTYKPREAHADTFTSFWNIYTKTIFRSETTQKRTLFGAHLDDIIIQWNGHNARLYASRGQQKLILLLIKCAMVRILKAAHAATNPTIVFILDDFITDLDREVINALLPILHNLQCVLVITCPLKNTLPLPHTYQRIPLPIV